MVNPAHSPQPESSRRTGGVNTQPAVILLAGKERYLKEKAIKDLRSSFLDNNCQELDYKVLHGTDTSADEILSSVSTIPFFSSKRLVVIKDFDRLSKEDKSRLINYIKNPNQYTCLIIDSDEGTIIEDDPSIARYLRVMRFSNPAEAETSSWIARFVSSRGKTIEEGAIEILRESHGGDLLSLSQEMEKLIAYAGSRNKITSADAEDLVGKSVLSSAFDIAHAVAEMDTSRAISIIRELSVHGKRPHEIIGLLSWHFKTLLRIKTLFSLRRTEHAVIQELRLPRKSAQALFTQSALYSYEQIGHKLQVLLEADLGIKRTKYSPSLILEFAVIRLCLAG